MVAPIPDAKKQEAIRLRVEERLGLDEIAARTGVSKSSLSTLLRDYPLTAEEIRGRISQTAIKLNHQRKYVPLLSKFAKWVSGQTLPTDRKGQIAEDAVSFRLSVLGFEVLDTRENSRADFVVTREGSDRYVRLQVKWARRENWGRPAVRMTNGEGKKIRRVTRETCDFVIGYDLETDTAFVMPIDVCEGKERKSCDEEYAEAWHLLGI